MKNKIKFTALILCLLIIATLCGCSKGLSPISSKDFEKTIGSNFEFKDVTSQVKRNTASVTEVIHATDSDGLEIEYWKFESDQKASIEFHNKRSRISTLCPNDNNWYQDGYENMVCTGSNGKMYFHLVRIDDTFIYSAVEINNKNKCLSLFQSLGYVIEKKSVK